MSLREELIAIINRLPEQDLARIAPLIRETGEKKRPRSLAESLERADALHKKLKDEVINMPGVVDINREMREERLNAIMGLR